MKTWDMIDTFTPIGLAKGLVELTNQQLDSGKQKKQEYIDKEETKVRTYEGRGKMRESQGKRDEALNNFENIANIYQALAARQMAEAQNKELTRNIGATSGFFSAGALGAGLAPMATPIYPIMDSGGGKPIKSGIQQVGRIIGNKLKEINPPKRMR